MRDIAESVDAILEFTRDKLIHDYPGVDTDVLWRTIEEVLPTLRSDLVEILREEGS